MWFKMIILHHGKYTKFNKQNLIISKQIDIAAKTDKFIIEKYIQTKDKTLVGELFKRYTGFVFLVSIKYLKDEDRSKDAVMQVFEKLFNNLLKHEIDNFKPWLHTVVRNHCLGLLRKDQSQQKNEQNLKVELDFMESEADNHLIVEQAYEKKISNLETALKQLKPEQKQCVELFYLQEKSYNEVTELTGFPIKKVKSYIQNGKRNLKIIMDKMGAMGLYFILFCLFDN
jgi:RNA polymerase sigma-70 factor (ECF subfamily)